MARAPAAQAPTGADPLARYHAKRDFTRTSEPEGKVQAQNTGKDALRFVVQKHAAKRLHYDLRLELDGVMKSWAVTRGPSLDPADKRLAVEVEDHPLDYRTFEGTIDEGYGAGTVMVWDQGTWEPDPEIDDPQAALEKGNLKFVLHGDRMRGSWDLVRMKPRPKDRQPQWLLIKRHDAEERPGEGGRLVEAATTSITTGRTMEQIAGGKPPKKDADGNAVKGKAAKDAAAEARVPMAVPERAARGAKTAKSTATLAGFVPLMLCTLVERPPEDPRWVHEIKLDGYRIEAIISGGQARLMTRNEKDWTHRFPETAEALGKLPDCILDGELVATGPDDQPDFAALQAAMQDGTTAKLRYYAFDLLALGGKDMRRRPLSERKDELKRLLVKPPPGVVFLEHFAEPGAALLGSACRLGLEGIVSKRRDSPYSAGRGQDWLKAKCRGNDEFVVGGYGAGAKGRMTLLLGAWRGGKLVYLGRVGSGISGQREDGLMRRLEPLQRKSPPFASTPASERRDTTWVEPRLVAEIDYTGWTRDGLLRQASYKGIREDKPAEEVGVPIPGEPPPDTGSRSASGKAEETRNPKASFAGVSLTHPDKRLWSEDGVTKRDLAAYYEAVGERLLAYIGDRPLTLVRTPDGIEGQHFIQRHPMRGTSSLLRLVRLPGEKQPYLAVDSVSGLIALAQAGVTEIHPWGAPTQNLEKPDRLIFDLDPADGLPFSDVIGAALELRQRLEQVGLVPFCKTTGGKGLHVVAPLVQKADWAEAHAFARSLCEAMAQSAPNQFTTNMVKRARTGRIFLDYLRNAKSATAVAAWSPRARPGATVSMPLAWREVKEGLDPRAFTVRTAPARLKQGDAWESFGAAARPLPQAI